MTPLALSVTSRLVREEFFAFVMYPVWWYTEGTQRVARWMMDGLVYRARKYAIGLWLQNLTVPMYGEYSLWGRVVSLVMRLVVIVARCIALFVEALIYMVCFALWLLWPLLAIVGLVYSLLIQRVVPLI